MKWIRIIRPAPEDFGIWPLEVRQAWVDVTIPIMDAGPVSIERVGDKTALVFRVSPNEAMRALRSAPCQCDKRKTAITWLEKNAQIRLMQSFNFPADNCELLNRSMD